MRNRVEVLHGVNFDVLGRRDPELYGGMSLPELEVQIKRYAHELDLGVTFFQSNFEGEFVEYLHRLPELADAAKKVVAGGPHACTTSLNGVPVLNGALRVSKYVPPTQANAEILLPA